MKIELCPYGLKDKGTFLKNQLQTLKVIEKGSCLQHFVLQQLLSYTKIMMKTKQQSSKRCFQKLGSATDSSSSVLSGLVAMKHFLIQIELLPYLGRAHFYGLKMNLELDSRVNITRGVLVTLYECKYFCKKREWGPNF